MHRHGYSGRKLNRDRDQRRALLRNLATALVEHEAIETTEPKAKELRPYLEKLITKAKVGTLHSRRQAMAGVDTREAGFKLVDHIAPALAGRQSGYLRIKRTAVREGDRAQLARVSFVDELKAPAKKPVVKATPKTAVKKVPAKPVAKKPAVKKVVKK